MFHKHRWVTTGVKFNQPVGLPTKATGFSLDDMLVMAKGFTNVTQTCSGCGRTATSRSTGQVDVKVDGKPDPMEAAR